MGGGKNVEDPRFKETHGNHVFNVFGMWLLTGWSSQMRNVGWLRRWSSCSFTVFRVFRCSVFSCALVVA